jgi:hypothetical protein
VSRGRCACTTGLGAPEPVLRVVSERPASVVDPVHLDDGAEAYPSAGPAPVTVAAPARSRPNAPARSGPGALAAAQGAGGGRTAPVSAWVGSPRWSRVGRQGRSAVGCSTLTAGSTCAGWASTGRASCWLARPGMASPDPAHNHHRNTTTRPTTTRTRTPENRQAQAAPRMALPSSSGRWRIRRRPGGRPGRGVGRPFARPGLGGVLRPG